MNIEKPLQGSRWEVAQAALIDGAGGFTLGNMSLGRVRDHPGPFRGTEPVVASIQASTWWGNRRSAEWRRQRSLTALADAEKELAEVLVASPGIRLLVDQVGLIWEIVIPDGKGFIPVADGDADRRTVQIQFPWSNQE